MRNPRLSHVLTALLALLVLVSVALTMRMAGAKGVVESRTHIPTCDEVGLCRKGEQQLLFNNESLLRGFALRYALVKGCKVTDNLNRRLRLTCPSGLNLPNTQTERIFKLKDSVSVEQIGATQAQVPGITGSGVLVAVLDTGVDTTHPELLGKVFATKNFTADGEGDVYGHGSHVSGIIAGRGTTVVGGRTVRGVATGATLIVGKVCGDTGYCLEGDITAGIEWAVAMGARVINLSLGGGSFLDECDSDPLAVEVNWAVSKGVSVVAAAGNSGASGEGVATPACASRAVAVGAVDVLDVRPSWSGYGQALDVAAPGVAILSSLPCSVTQTCPSPGYARWSGTSMATPHVAGVAALLLQVFPALTPDELASTLRTTAHDLGGSGFDTYYGYGRLDTVAAVAALRGGSSSSSSSSFSSSSVIASSSSSSIDASSSSAPASSSSPANSSSSPSESSSSSIQSSSSVSSSASSTSSHMPPACSINDWFCKDAGECSNEGHQEQRCELRNPHCTRPEAVKPTSTRSCTPPWNDHDGNEQEQESSKPSSWWPWGSHESSTRKDGEGGQGGRRETGR